MPRRGFVLTDAVVCEARGRVWLVQLVNGHRLHARARLRDWQRLPEFRTGDRVWVEVPVSDPSQGLVVPEQK